MQKGIYNLEMRLLEGEKQVLEDGYAGFRQKLILTNKRLVTIEKKGLFTTYWQVIREIPLEQIEEAYVQPGGAFSGQSAAMLKMKNGNSFEMGLKLPDSQAFAADFGGEGLAGMDLRLKTINDRWVNAINSQLRGSSGDRTQELEDRIRELERRLKEK